MQLNSFSTTRTARYISLGEPGPEVQHVWFCLHTEGQPLSDFAAQLVNLDTPAEQVLAQCPAGVPVTVLGYGQGAAAACRWLAGGRIDYERLVLYASVFPPEIDRRATLVALPDKPVTLVSTTTDVYTPEAAGEGLLQDLHDVGLNAQLRYVSDGPLTLAALGAAAEARPE